MSKYFNTTGPRIPDIHYMLPPADRCEDLHRLINEGRYFVIHAPRQVGKTTLIQSFVEELNNSGQALALYCTLETARVADHPKRGIPIILSALKNAVKWNRYAADKNFGSEESAPEAALRSALEDYCARLDKPLVIMFDEVDCLAQDTLLSFLSQLREGFVNRRTAPFIHALALVGMRNIRDDKRGSRAGHQTLGSASPFNFVFKALTLRNLCPSGKGP